MFFAKELLPFYSRCYAVGKNQGDTIMHIHRTLALTAVALAAIGLSACKDEARTQTESREKTVMSDGTQVETKTQTDVKVDEQGNRTGTVESTTTVDPEGMMNKETIEETHEEIQE